jgi:hypothetical protein
LTYEDLGVFNNKCTIKCRIYIYKLLSTFAIIVKKQKIAFQIRYASKPHIETFFDSMKKIDLKDKIQIFLVAKKLI